MQNFDPTSPLEHHCHGMQGQLEFQAQEGSNSITNCTFMKDNRTQVHSFKPAVQSHLNAEYPIEPQHNFLPVHIENSSIKYPQRDDKHFF